MTPQQRDAFEAYVHWVARLVDHDRGEGRRLDATATWCASLDGRAWTGKTAK